MSDTILGHDPAPPGKFPINKILADSDLDGVVSAAMLRIVYPNAEIIYAEATGMTEGKYDRYVDEGTLIVDLKYRPGCGLYFDHHESNLPQTTDFAGQWRNTDSAARVIYDYFRGNYDLSKFAKIVDDVDKLDMGKLTLEEYINPSEVIKLGLTINRTDLLFNSFVSELLADQSWEFVQNHHLIKSRVNELLLSKKKILKHIKEYSVVRNGIGFIDVTDFSEQFKVGSFDAVSQLPQTDAVAVFKQEDSDSGYKVRLYKNNFNADAFDYDLLKVVKTINPKVSGGHRVSCGMLPPQGMSKQEVKERIFEELMKQKL